MTPDQVRTAMLGEAVDGVITDVPSGTPNLLLHSLINLTPTISPAPNTPPSATPSQAPTSCDGHVFVLDLTLDNYPGETWWTLVDNDDGSVYMQVEAGTYGGMNGENVFLTDCTPAAGSYKFTIYDTYGDGICCGYGLGSYDIHYGGTRFTPEETFTGNMQETVLELPPMGPPTEPPSDSPSASPSASPSTNPTKSPKPSATPSVPPTDSPADSPSDMPTDPRLCGAHPCGGNGEKVEVCHKGGRNKCFDDNKAAKSLQDPRSYCGPCQS